MQEEGNIPYVIDNGVGTFEKQPSKIADIVVDWFGAGAATFKDMAVKAKALGRPEVRGRLCVVCCRIDDGSFLFLFFYYFALDVNVSAFCSENRENTHTQKTYRRQNRPGNVVLCFRVRLGVLVFRQVSFEQKLRRRLHPPHRLS